MIGKKLKTLDAWNQECLEIARREKLRKALAHVACDRCGTEMHYKHPEVTDAQGVVCPQCGYEGLKLLRQKA